MLGVGFFSSDKFRLFNSPFFWVPDIKPTGFQAEYFSYKVVKYDYFEKFFEEFLNFIIFL